MNDIYCGALFSEAYLEHFGVKGMRWGVRRYENKDGSLTEAGKRRYGKRLAKELNREDAKRVGALTRAQYSNKVYRDESNRHNKLVDKLGAKAQKHPERSERYEKKLAKSLKRTTRAGNTVNTNLAETSKHEKRMNELMKEAERSGIKLDKKAISRAGHHDGVNQYFAPGVKYGVTKNKAAKRGSGVKRGLIVAGSLALAAVATNQLIVSQASSSSISRGRNQTIKVLNGGLKGAGKLKDLTMDDLKRLDLY